MGIASDVATDDWTEAVWAAYWLAFLLCFISWAFWSVALGVVWTYFGSGNRADRILELEVYAVCPLVLAVSGVFLVRRKFNLASAVIMCIATFGLVWLGPRREADLAAILDLVAVGLGSVAIWRRKIELRTLALVALAVVATIWFAAHGKMSVEELMWPTTR